MSDFSPAGRCRTIWNCIQMTQRCSLRVSYRHCPQTPRHWEFSPFCVHFADQSTVVCCTPESRENCTEVVKVWSLDETGNCYFYLYLDCSEYYGQEEYILMEIPWGIPLEEPWVLLNPVALPVCLFEVTVQCEADEQQGDLEMVCQVGNYWTMMKQALTVKCQKDLYKNQTSDNHGFLSLPIGYFPGYVGRLGDPTKVECGGPTQRIKGETISVTILMVRHHNIWQYQLIRTGGRLWVYVRLRR